MEWLKTSLLANHSQGVYKTQVEKKTLQASLDVKKKSGGTIIRTRSPPPVINISRDSRVMNGNANQIQFEEDILDFLKMNNENVALASKMMFVENQPEFLKVPSIIPADSAPQQAQNYVGFSKENQGKLNQSDRKLPKINGRYYQMKRKEQDVRENASPKPQIEPGEAGESNLKKTVRKTTFGSKV